MAPGSSRDVVHDPFPWDVDELGERDARRGSCVIAGTSLTIHRLLRGPMQTLSSQAVLSAILFGSHRRIRRGRELPCNGAAVLHDEVNSIECRDRETLASASGSRASGSPCRTSSSSGVKALWPAGPLGPINPGRLTKSCAWTSVRARALEHAARCLFYHCRWLLSLPKEDFLRVL